MGLVHADRRKGLFVVAPTGDVIADTAALQSAAAQLSDRGSGTLGVEGSYVYNDFINFNGGIAIEGMTNDAVLVSRVTGAGNMLDWNSSVTQIALEAGTHGPVFAATATAGSNEISAIGHTFQRGQWVLIWSEDQIPNSRGHSGFEDGAGAHPAEMHQIAEQELNVLKIEGFIAYDYTAGALAKVAVIPMVRNVVIKNIAFDFDTSAGDPADFNGMIRLRGCENFVIDGSVRVLRNGAGAIWASLSTGVIGPMQIDGAAKVDNTYGHAVDAVNHVQYQGGMVKGTRHSFTTLNSKTLNDSWSVTVPAPDTLDTGTAHGLIDGQHVFLIGTTPPTGLQFNTSYWVTNAGGTTLGLSATPGGAALTWPVSGSNITLRRAGRWATPRGVILDGMHHTLSSGGPPSASVDKAAFDTHVEGYGVTFKNISAEINGDDNNIGITGRAQYTEFRDIKLLSRAAGNARAFGGRLSAEGCAVIGGTIEGFFEGLSIQATTGTVNSTFGNCRLDNILFVDHRATPIKVSHGSNHSFTNLRFINCSQVNTNTPYNSRHLMQFTTTEGGQKVWNCSMPKDANLYSIDPGQLDETQIDIRGCDLTGYGPGDSGIGRTHNATIPDTSTVWTTSTGHGYSVDEQVELDSDDTLPGNFAENQKYFVVAVPAINQLELSLTLQGSPIAASGVGIGTHRVISPHTKAIRAKYHPLNKIDPIIEIGQLADDGSLPTQVMAATTPVPVSGFVQEIFTGRFVVDAPTALIQMPDVLSAETLWAISIGGSLAVSSNNVVVTFSYWINGSYVDDLTTVSIQQSGNSQSISLPNVFFQLPIQNSPKIQLYVETSSATTLTYTSLTFNIGRVET